jgi:nucleotide-binding universal stress UspA family protein
MIAMDQVLCLIDFSDGSPRVLEHAMALARGQAARLYALHVLHFAPALPMAPSPVHPTATLPPGPRVRRASLEKLERAVEPARRSGVEVQTMVEVGEVVPVVLEEVKRLSIDVVVMGRGGAGGFERLVMGSVAEKLLHKAPCPVLTVERAASGEPVREPVRYRRILCPVDLSEASAQVLDYGLCLAEGPHSTLTLLYVQEEILFPFLPFERTIEGAPSEAAVLESIEHRLRTLLPGNVDELCSPAVMARRGWPAEKILEVAREEGSDVIVLGVHSRGPLERFLLGSVANRVIRGAACPVLAVRATTRAPDKRAVERQRGAGEPRAEPSRR